MRKWLTAFALIAAMLGGAVGAGAHEGEGSMANMPDCCKKAQSSSSQCKTSSSRLDGMGHPSVRTQQRHTRPTYSPSFFVNLTHAFNGR